MEIKDSGDELQPFDYEPDKHRRLVKVCGLKNPENIRAIAKLRPDFMGFIFYPKSPRYVEPFPSEIIDSIPPEIKKTGIFVNDDLHDILTAVHKYRLDAVQLHGSDMEKICRKLRETDLTIIKAFSIATSCNFIPTKHYEGLCDYFVFDTKTEHHGGSGCKFNWNMLHEYKGKTPFLLSGGIAPDDINAVLSIDHPKMIGVDLNSRFEIKPGLKDVDKLKEFIRLLNLHHFEV